MNIFGATSTIYLHIYISFLQVNQTNVGLWIRIHFKTHISITLHNMSWIHVANSIVLNLDIHIPRVHLIAPCP
jgi:hypothetical protein